MGSITKAGPMGFVTFVAISCGGGAEQGATSTPTAVAEVDTGIVWQRVELPGLPDNVRHDTLLIQTTFDLGSGNFLMVASNVDETREGVRLYLYRPDADSSAQVLAASKPGYDSATMFPTFFQCADTSQGWVILANMGERESWWQEAFWLKDATFNYLGNIGAAQRDWKSDGDSTWSWRTNIGPRAVVSGGNGVFNVRFSGDSLMLNEDGLGGIDVMYPTARVSFGCAEGHSTLLIDGKAVQPAS